MLKYSILSCSLLFINLICFDTSIAWHTPEKEASVYITIPVEQEDALYKEYMDFSADHDAVTITHWSSSDDAVAVYDPIFKETKKIYTHDATFKVDLTIKHPIEETSLRCTYYRKNKGCIEEYHIPIHVASTQEVVQPLETALAAQDTIIETQVAAPAENNDTNLSWSCTISNLIERTQSIWLQCLLILLLGALLSLTPCIYPMIPITVGILQGQGSKSIWRNLLLSGCYTMGIATTFALLGIVAAYTGKLFGTFMHHPLVIGLIVMLLVYLAGSMFGFYEMYVPKSFSSNSRFTQGGSPLAAFLFGAVSGTVASPCVSPGLALVLSIVTGLANPFIGFLFLFVFGVGLSLPLLIIGTFSGSLTLLPRVGFWMVEIKKMFGFLLLGMALYFLNIIVPQWVGTWLLALLLCSAGVYYLYGNTKKPFMKRQCNNFLGIILITSSIITGYFAIRAIAHPEECSIIGLWTTDYACARAQAQHEQKLLLLKVEAPCCSMCTAIDKKLFHQTSVSNTLDTYYIPVRIDGGDSNDAHIALMQQFKVIGFPTILIIDPNNEHVIKRWASELYDYSVEQFIAELESKRFS